MCLKTLLKKKWFNYNQPKINQIFRKQITLMRFAWSAFHTHILPRESPLIILKLLKETKKGKNKKYFSYLMFTDFVGLKKLVIYILHTAIHPILASNSSRSRIVSNGIQPFQTDQSYNRSETVGLRYSWLDTLR
jgi:hypothetical protein